MKQYTALRVWLLVNNCSRSGLGLWGLTPLSTIFQLYRAVVQFFDLNVKIYIYIYIYIFGNVYTDCLQLKLADIFVIHVIENETYNARFTFCVHPWIICFFDQVIYIHGCLYSLNGFSLSVLLLVLFKYFG